MSFFQTTAENLRCCGTASTMQDESARQCGGNGKALESTSFEIHKTIMTQKCWKMLGNISDCMKKVFLYFTALSVLAWRYTWIILSESISLQHISVWTWKYSVIVIWMTLSAFFKTDICMSEIVLILDLFIKWNFLNQT